MGINDGSHQRKLCPFTLTVLTSWISNPLAARSVAKRTSTSPFLNFSSASSRCGFRKERLYLAGDSMQKPNHKRINTWTNHKLQAHKTQNWFVVIPSLLVFPLHSSWNFTECNAGIDIVYTWGCDKFPWSSATLMPSSPRSMCILWACFLVWIKMMQWSWNVLDTKAARWANQNGSTICSTAHVWTYKRWEA